MRAVLLREFGPPARLVAEDAPDPVAGQGQALIDVEFANITFIETQLRAGNPPVPAMAPQLPAILGNGVGGVVSSVGAGADTALTGRRVITTTGGSGGYAERVAGELGGPACRRQEMLCKLDDERLTGMSTTQLEQLATSLAPAQAARAQQRYSQQRGGRARRATGNLRAKPLLDDAARLLITLLYQRQVCSMNVLADLLEVTATCIGDLVKQTREMLEDHGHHPGTALLRFTTPQALLSFLDSGQRPARAAIIEQLSHPALTGLTRDELRKLTERLAAQQAAQAERLTYQRRGGQRQPGTRGGVFPQKISNSERVLLTILHHRKLCTLDGLAEALGDVSRSAVGNVIRETLPLLQQEGHIPSRAPTRYHTAADLLAAGPASSDTPTS